MHGNAKFDATISARTILLTAIIGFLASYYPPVKTVPEISMAVGAILGGIYDFIAFKIKTRFDSAGGGE